MASSRSGASALRGDANAICPWSRLIRAARSSSGGPSTARDSSRPAASGAPAWYFARAASSSRSARRAGSPVSSAARSRNAAAAAMPPRAWARPADDASSAATSSSGNSRAYARCHARRSGSVPGSVTSASAACARRRSPAVAARYAADRTSVCRNTTRSPIVSSPDASSWSPASVPSSSRRAASHSRVASPTGSAAASSVRGQPVDAAPEALLQPAGRAGQCLGQAEAAGQGRR